MLPSTDLPSLHCAILKTSPVGGSSGPGCQPPIKPKGGDDTQMSLNYGVFKKKKKKKIKLNKNMPHAFSRLCCQTLYRITLQLYRMKRHHEPLHEQSATYFISSF